MIAAPHKPLDSFPLLCKESWAVMIEFNLEDRSMSYPQTLLPSLKRPTDQERRSSTLFTGSPEG